MIVIGIGKEIKRVVPQGPYTISFIVYNENLPATQTGDAPIITDKMAGETFIIPDQGNLVRTEITYQSPPGGGPIQQIPTNIALYGWTDGNGLYFPGDTYTMPNSNITLTAIWQTLYSANLVDAQPYTVSPGDIITLTGFNLGSAQYIGFDNFIDSTDFTVISDEEIRAVVPIGAESGSISISLIAGGADFIFDAYEIV